MTFATALIIAVALTIGFFLGYLANAFFSGVKIIELDQEIGALRHKLDIAQEQARRGGP